MIDSEGERMMVHEDAVAKIIVDAAFKIHMLLGPGLLESVYETVLAYELEQRGLRVERQVAVPVKYEGLQFDEGFRLDLMVEELVVVELKAVGKTIPIYKKQTLTYVKLTEKRLGLLINFGAPLIKNGIYRLVNGLPE